jgi:pyrimidine deaminase RibD-like protein
MNLKELHSFQISDAVAFHDELNPKLWNNNNLRPEVKKQLEIVAQDFLSELGVDDLDVQDITVSGSNAAYSYTPHSDLDLHILVDMSKLDNNEIYKELFHAKKNIYNDTHNILIHGVPVELYVQDARKPVTSLGEYSIKDNKWLRLPTKRRANFDQNATKAKYEKLQDLIEFALNTRRLGKVEKTIKKIKQYRQAGLDKGGEFGPENLAYKMLRNQGYITKLYDLRDKLHSEVLTIETMYQDPVKIQEENLATLFRNEFANQLDEARVNPEQNYKFGSGKYELIAATEGISDKSNWGVSMTLLPKLGINPKPGVSEDTPKGIYFYPLDYFISMVKNKKRLPWGDDLPYMQLFQYDNSHMMTPDTKVPFEDMKRALSEYGVTDRDIQDTIDEPSMSARKGINDPLWFIYDALGKQFTNDERRIIVWNKILRNLGFTVLFDNGKSWIAFGEPYQGCVLDIRAIKQHKTFTNYVQGDKLSMKQLSDAVYWNTTHLKAATNIRQQLSSQVAKEMLSQYLGMSPQEAKQNGYDEAIKKAVARVGELASSNITESQEEIHNYPKLDHTLAKLCKLVIEGQKSDKDYGMVAACVIDPDNNFVTGLNTPGIDGKRIHAERVAIEKYENEYGPVPEGSIIVTTLSPCNEQHDETAAEREGESCTDYINSKGIEKVYCGYNDPTQDNNNREFNMMETSNKELRAICKKFADTFLSEDDTMQFAAEKTADISPYAGVEDNQFRGGIYEATEPKFVYHVTPTKNLKSIAKQGLTPTVGDRTSQIAGEKSGIYVFPDQVSAEDAVMNWLGDEFDDEPLTMLKIDISGLENNISKGADYELIVDTIIEPKRIKKLNVQLEEASGYIPSEKEKNDPRFKTALTVDVHPDSIKKNAKAFYWKTSRAGIPPTANANGKI